MGAADGSFVVKATRPIAAGEEVCISYGSEKSNVRLFRAYGFTLPPESVTSCSCRLWPKAAPTAWAEFLPEGSQRPMDLELSHLDATTVSVLAMAEDAAAFLRAACQVMLEAYRQDASLQTALAQLDLARAANPSSAQWWPDEPEGGGPSGMDLSVCAVRVKM